MISNENSITLSSSTMQDGCIDPSNNELYVVESSTPSMRKFNLSTLSQVGSNISISSSPGAIVVINSASSVIASTSLSSVDYVENATGYKTTTGTTGSAIYSTSKKGQRGAGDLTNGIAMFCSQTANTLNIANSSGVLSKVTINGMTNFVAHCIILKSAGRFLVGGKFGKIYEVDTSGTIHDELTITLVNNTGLLGNYNTTVLDLPTINYLGLDGNLLVATSDESIHLYDYSTKTFLEQHQVNNNNAADQIVLCNSSSGETLLSYNVTTTASNVVKEVNFTTYGLHVNAPSGVLYTDVTNPIFCTGFNSATSQGWALQATAEKIRVFTVSAPSTSMQTFNVPPGFNNARLIVLDDTGGVGTIKKVLGTFQLTGNQYRMPTGKTLIILWKCLSGTIAQWYESRVST